jgi:hypothetical protein
MQREHRAGARPTPDHQLPPDAAALPVAPPSRDAGGYDAGYQAAVAARISMERRRRQVRWLFWSWLLYWGSLLVVQLQPTAAALWARDVARTTAAREPIQLMLTLDTASPTLLWIALGPLVLTLLWLLLVRRRARR